MKDRLKMPPRDDNKKARYIGARAKTCTRSIGPELNEEKYYRVNKKTKAKIATCTLIYLDNY